VSSTEKLIAFCETSCLRRSRENNVCECCPFMNRVATIARNTNSQFCKLYKFLFDCLRQCVRISFHINLNWIYTYIKKKTFYKPFLYLLTFLFVIRHHIRSIYIALYCSSIYIKNHFSIIFALHYNYRSVPLNSFVKDASALYKVATTRYK